MHGKITQAYAFKDSTNPVFEYSKPNPKAGYAVTAFRVKLWNGKNTDFTSWRNVPIDGDTYTIVLTDTERTNLLSYASKVDTLIVWYTLSTVINGVEYIDEATANLLIVDAEPEVRVNVWDINARTVALTGNTNILVKHYSKAEYRIIATPKKGATIDSYYLKCGSEIRDTESGNIDGVESNTFYVAATDSRSVTARNFVVKELIPYVKLTCKNVHIDNFTTAGELTFTISGKYFDGSFGNKNNTMELEYALEENGGDIVWYRAGYVNPIVDHNYNYTLTYTIKGLNYLSNYKLTVNVIDELTPAQTTSAVAAVKPIFDWSKEDFNFNIPVKAEKNIIVNNNESSLSTVGMGGGVYYQNDEGGYNDLISVLGDDVIINGSNALKGRESTVIIAGDRVCINTDTLADYVIEEGTDNLYSYRKWYSGKLEAWRSTQNTVTVSTTKGAGALYYTNDLKLTVSGTPAFTAVESVQLTINKNNVAGLFFPILISYGISAGVVSINYLIANYNIANSAAIIPYVNVVGRWK